MPQVRLDVRGYRGEVIWLINGRAVGRSRAGEGIVHRFAGPGRYAITALDDSGHHERVEIAVED
jgi:membrane carboxypeptidase/penicillin-binding protein PbpC